MTTSLSADQIYEQQIKALPRTAQLRLLARIADGLAATSNEADAELNLLDLEGVGAALWQDEDAQHYVDAERDTWDRPS